MEELLPEVPSGEDYTTATGSYTDAWSMDVNLDPPFPDVQIPFEDTYITQYYKALQYTLYETNLPETVDRTDQPRKDHQNGATMVLLSSPVECMSVLLEGSRKCPGCMLLVLSTTWLTKSRSQTDPHLFSLFVHKAIVFESGRRTFLDVFQIPRRVTYFVNFFTNACTEGQREDGEELEIGLDCPTSSSLKLVKMVDDKLLTRILLAKAGVAYPETLAFPYRSSTSYESKIDSIKVVPLSGAENLEELFRTEILHFITNHHRNRTFDQVVVKPSGVRWHGSVGVTFHSRNDIDGICSAAVRLAAKLKSGDSVLVEAFIETMPPLYYRDPENESIKRSKQSLGDFSFRVRATTCRNMENVAVVSKIVCGVGSTSRPVSGDNTCPQSLDTTLIQWGVLDEAKRKETTELVREKSEAAMGAILEFESGLSAHDRGGVGAQTDVIGIDFILAWRNVSIVPVAIEVNSHDCMINCQIYEFINRESMGEAARPLVETMIARSQLFVMAGKKVLVIGAGGYSKKFVWELAKGYGIQVYLVDSDRSHHAADDVALFIKYDLSDHSRDAMHADKIAALAADLDVDGCLTFWEDCMPLAASVCERLGLKSGPGLRPARIAKKKSLTYGRLSQCKGDIPHWPRTCLYSSRCQHISKHEDIERAAETVGFPAVIKLEFGSSAVGVKLVRNIEQCYQEYDLVRGSLQKESDLPGVGLSHGNSMVLMEFISGSEHDVDVIIYEKKLLASFVSDNGPTRLPYFTETAAMMPSGLPPEKQNQLIAAAYQCCVDVGLVSGVFNVEMKMTPKGAKLIEINARMGGFYLPDWIKACYGADIVFYSMMIACGVKPVVLTTGPRGCLLGIMCVPSQHRSVTATLKNPLIWRELAMYRSKVRCNFFAKDLAPESRYEEPFCNIAVMDANAVDAKTALLEICDYLGVNKQSYQCARFLQDFVIRQ